MEISCPSKAISSWDGDSLFSMFISQPRAALDYENPTDNHILPQKGLERHHNALCIHPQILVYNYDTNSFK